METTLLDRSLVIVPIVLAGVRLKPVQNWTLSQTCEFTFDDN